MTIKKLETITTKRKQVSKMQSIKKKATQRAPKKLKICDHLTDSALPQRSVKLLHEIVDVLADNKENVSKKQKKENSQLSKRLKKALKTPEMLEKEKKAKLVKPKKPANSFIQFVQSQKPKEGKYSVTELTKKLALKWKTMSDEEKQTYKKTKTKPKKKINVDDEELLEEAEMPAKPKTTKKQLIALIKKNKKSDLSSAKLEKMKNSELENMLE